MPNKQTGFKKQTAVYGTHYQRLLVDVVHVQSHQVLPAAQVQAALILIHQEDAVVAGVEREAEGPGRFCVHELCVENVTALLKKRRKGTSGTFGKAAEGRTNTTSMKTIIPFVPLTCFITDLDELAVCETAHF